MLFSASTVGAPHGRYEDLETGMDVPVTEDVVRELVTRMLCEHNKTATKALITAARFEREDEDGKMGDE